MEWMAWTLPTALFFCAIASAITLYTYLGFSRPSQTRLGILPMATTRGDRLFIGLLATAFLNLLWAGLTEAPQWWAAALWVPVLWVIGRWG
jgi:predicted small integral membrane protein